MNFDLNHLEALSSKCPDFLRLNVQTFMACFPSNLQILIPIEQKEKFVTAFLENEFMLFNGWYLSRQD